MAGDADRRHNGRIRRLAAGTVEDRPDVRLLLRLLLLAVVLMPPALVGAAWLALAERPLVAGVEPLSAADIARARALVERDDPRRLPPGSEQTVRLGERQLELAIDYLIQRVGDGGARVALRAGVLDALASVRLPALPARPWINVDLQASQGAGGLRLERLRVGALSIPAPLAHRAVRLALDRLYARGDYRAASRAVTGLRIDGSDLVLTWRWDPALVDEARGALLAADDRAELAFWHGELVRLVDAGIAGRGSLAPVLGALLARAEARGGDPVASNRALLTVLGAWAGGRGLARLVPQAPRRPGPFRMRLAGRRDFAQHFLISAALAARSDDALADAVGLAKELDDSERGSGFSFTDIAADRAGTRFGALATRSATDARRLQRLAASGIGEGDLIPDTRDLPEGLSAQEFRQRYGRVGSPAYERVMATIERRIAALRPYRG